MPAAAQAENQRDRMMYETGPKNTLSQNLTDVSHETTLERDAANPITLPPDRQSAWRR